MAVIARVQPGPFDVAAEIAALDDAAPGGPAGTHAGGLGCFIGRVRGGGNLVALTLEHYPGMTQSSLRAIADRAVARFGLAGCTIVHRFGRLLPGDPIVLVLATSAHRAAALDATRFMIDWLKTEAPFWKCEEFADGTRSWIERRAEDDAARQAWLSPSSSA